MANCINVFYHFLSRTLAQVTVEPVMFLYMFTNFLYFPILQSLIFDKVCLGDFNSEFCKQLKSNHTDPLYHHVNSQTSYWILMTSVAITVPSAIVVLLFYGSVGDKIGRKIPVILPCVGALAAYVSFLLNAHFISGSVYFILIGPVINGCCGGFIACIMSVYSYVAHITSTRSKMMRISIVEASIFLAGTIGVFVSGVTVESIGYEYTALLLVCAISLALIYSIVYLENVRANHHTPINRKSCLTLISSYIKDSTQCVGKRREARVFSTIMLQVICIDILMLCTSGDMDITFIYLRERLGYNQVLYGYYKGLDNLLRGLILITLPHLVKRFLDMNDFYLVLIGIASYTANFIILGVASAKWLAFLAAVLGMFKGLPSAGLRSRMSVLVSQDEQGRLFGLIAATESVITLIASVLFNSLFPATYDIFPGFCYFIGVTLLIVCFVLVICIMRMYPNVDDSNQRCSIMEDDAEILSPGSDDEDSDSLSSVGYCVDVQT